jgi:RNA polymerase sigma-70 factor, ECF subfamily
MSDLRENYPELIRENLNQVLGICRGILQNETQAEDAAQDIFVKAYQQLKGFHGRSEFSTWLYRIAVNHCLDLRRKSSRKPTESLENLTQQPGTPGPEEALEKKDLAERLLAGLSEAERAALVLRESQGLSYEEIALVLKISTDAVKSRLKRARENIEQKARHFSRLDNV